MSMHNFLLNITPDPMSACPHPPHAATLSSSRLKGAHQERDNHKHTIVFKKLSNAILTKASQERDNHKHTIVFKKRGNPNHTKAIHERDNPNHTKANHDLTVGC